MLYERWASCSRIQIGLVGVVCLLLVVVVYAGYSFGPIGAEEYPKTPPEIISTAATMATEDDSYSYDVEAVDHDIGDWLSYSLVISPKGMTLDARTGLIQWKPDNSQVGEHSVNVRVQDVDGLQDTQSFTVTVANVNDAPEITSIAVTDAVEDEDYIYEVEVMDSDVGDELAYLLATCPEGMTLDARTGLIQWMPDNSQVGEHAVAVQVQDVDGLQDTQSFTVTVANVNDAPEITSIAVTEAVEDEDYIYEVEGNDPDVGDEQTYSLATCPEGMTLDARTGLIQWKPDNSQVGEHSVNVRMQDMGGLQGTQNFTVTVANVNDAPEITSIAMIEAVEDEDYIYEIEVNDPDIGDELAYLLATCPEGMTFDARAGLIQWTPDNSQVGEHAVEVMVQDVAGLYDRQGFILTVVNVNDAPEITSIEVTSANEDQVYSYDVEAIDIDIGDQLTYSLGTCPDGMTINVGTGLIHWIPDKAQVGDNPVTVQAEDREGLLGVQSFSITVVANVVEKYAVIVGISDYEAVSDLRYCDEDATSWYNYLVGKGYTCWVYGDGHTQDYPRYDGKASEYNVRHAIRNVMELADSNDHVAFVFSGHGNGDGRGNSSLCLWDAGMRGGSYDGYYRDTELAADFESCRADKLFVFLDACYSGGMNEVVSIPNAGHVYMTTTCTQRGYGWDLQAFSHGAWTHFFLVLGLEGYGHNNWDMATCYDWAYAQYKAYYRDNLEDTGDWNGPDFYDHPNEFDTHPGTDFYQ